MKHTLYLLVGLLASAMFSAAQGKQPNVLLICVDDLRPQLASYGYTFMHTPHMDRLAKQGRAFTRHYVAAPTCGASRYALLTGLRPSKTRALGNGAFGRIKKDSPAPTTVVHHLRRNGYRTVGIGKISHSPDGYVYGYNKPPSDQLELPQSWDDVRLPLGDWQHGWASFFAYADGTGRNARRQRGEPVPAFESADVRDTGYPDGLIAEDAVSQLRDLAQRDKPFCLAVGFFKPHLPFNAPKKYWDLYPPDTIDLAPTNTLKNQSGGEFWGYTHPKNVKSDADYHRRVRRAYYASVSYVDAQVGKVLDAVDQLGLRDNTIVILWGDHGWHLGDLNRWGKHTLHEWSLRSPLIVRTPNMPAPGEPTDAIVETLDVYPTLIDLCGLPAVEGLHGESIRPVLDNPEHPGKSAAIGYWRNGRSIRVPNYRLINGRKPRLYDHTRDPDEAHDVADQHPELVKKLMEQLQNDSPRLLDAD